jgi:hypothetical protein
LPAVEQRRALIKEQLAAAESELEDAAQNCQQLSAEIRAIADAALEKVARLSGEKLLQLRSARTELLRKQAELDAFSELVSLTRKRAGPVGFLRAAEREAAAANALAPCTDFPVIASPGTLVLKGGLEVSEVPPLRTPTRPRTLLPRLLRPGEIEPQDDEQKVSRGPPPSPDMNSSLMASSMHQGDDGVISLTALAQRKEERYRSRNLEINPAPFAGSSILTTPGQAQTLYLCFPFRCQPQTHLLFSSARHGRSIRKCHEMVDNVGITAVIIQTGDVILGGFAAAKWRSDGQPFGNGRNSFVFNLTRDALVPFRPRADDACHLFATPDCFCFGRRDLVLDGDFDSCRSSLENAYSVGFEPGGEDANTFLAGKHEFVADVVEIWGFYTVREHAE